LLDIKPGRRKFWLPVILGEGKGWGRGGRKVGWAGFGWDLTGLGDLGGADDISG